MLRYYANAIAHFLDDGVAGCAADPGISQKPSPGS